VAQSSRQAALRGRHKRVLCAEPMVSYIKEAAEKEQYIYIVLAVCYIPYMRVYIWYVI